MYILTILKKFRLDEIITNAIDNAIEIKLSNPEMYGAVSNFLERVYVYDKYDV